MGLDRTELAARFAEADWRNPRAEPLPLGEWGRTLVAYADDLIAALALTPPVAPKSEAAKYEPEAPVHARIGDTIRVTRLKGREWTFQVHSVTPQGFAVNRAFSENSREEPQYGEYVGDYEIVTKGPLWPVSPSPDATRPTHVRVTCRAHSDRHVTIGKVYEVVLWNDDGSPDVIDDDGDDLSLSLPDGSDVECWPSWEPATPPSPVEPAKGEARDEAVALLKTFRKRLKWDGRAGDWILRSEIGDDLYTEDPTHEIDAILAARGAS